MRTFLILTSVFAIIAIAFLASTSSSYWSGGYFPAEIELHLVDGRGQPVPEVTVEVVDRQGAPVYFYPVSNHTPHSEIFSDGNGVVRLLHLSWSSVEFGDRHDTLLFGLVSLRGGDEPNYYCRFKYDGIEQQTIPYSELNSLVRNGVGQEMTRTINLLGILGPVDFNRLEKGGFAVLHCDKCIEERALRIAHGQLADRIKTTVNGEITFVGRHVVKEVILKGKATKEGN